MPEPVIEPGTSRTTVQCVTSETPRHLNVSIKAKLHNCFNVMSNGLKHTKKAKFTGHNFPQIHFFCYI